MMPIQSDPTERPILMRGAMMWFLATFGIVTFAFGLFILWRRPFA